MRRVYRFRHRGSALRRIIAEARLRSAPGRVRHCEESHALRVEAEVRGTPLRGEGGRGEERQYLALAVGGEARHGALAPIVGEGRAHEAGESGNEEAVPPRGRQEGVRVGEHLAPGRHHVGEHEPAIVIEPETAAREQCRELVLREILDERVRDDEVERVRRNAVKAGLVQDRDILGPAKAAREPRARTGRAAS